MNQDRGIEVIIGFGNSIIKPFQIILIRNLITKVKS